MIRKKIAEYLDLYLETYREALSFISETRASIESLALGQAKLINHLHAVEQRPYLVTVTLRGKSTEDKPLQMGTIAWLKPGELKYITIQPQVTIKDIHVLVTGAIITQCRIATEEFITGGNAVIHSVVCNTVATPGNIIRIAISLPVEQDAPFINIQN